MALLDANTYKAIPASEAKKSVHKEVILAQGSFHTVDALTPFIGGLLEAPKSRKINGNYISKFYVSKPNRAQNQVLAIGYNGVSECNSITGVCDTTYTLRIEVKDSPALRVYGRNLYRDIQIHTPCCDDCAEGCESAPADPIWMADRFVEEINSDKQLSAFVKAEKIFTCDPAVTVNPDNVLYNIYHLQLCDDGSQAALASIQNQYQAFVVKRVDRVAGTSQSVYELFKLASTGAPTAFANGDIRVIPQCATCPVGYTLVAKAYKVLLRREEAATANGNSISSYGATSSTYLNHEKGVSTYYLYLTAPWNPATALAVQGDVIIDLGEVVESVCFLDVVSTVAWTLFGTAYKTSRTLCITLGKDCGGQSPVSLGTTTTSTTTTSSTSTTSTTTVQPIGSSLLAVRTFFTGNTQIVPNSIVLLDSSACAEVIQVRQYSNNFLINGCDTVATPTYDTLQSFNGVAWDECPCVEDVASVGCSVGIKLTAAFVETKFGICSFHPSDHFELEPVRILASLVDRDGNTCDADVWSITELKAGKSPAGSGEQLLRDYILGLNYKAVESRFDSDPRYREVKDYVGLNVVDRNKFYKTYSIIHHIPEFDRSRLRINQEVYVLNVSFPEDADTTAFETLIGSYAASNDVFLEAY